MNPKLQWLRNKMSSLDMQGIIISNPVNIKYLTNIDAEGTLIINPKENIFITDGRYIEHVHSILTLYDEIIVYNINDVSMDDYENFFMFCENVGFEENYITYAKYKEYIRKFKINNFVETEYIIEKQRMIKDDEEIDEINILRASFLAMHRAVDQLTTRPQHLLIDGNRFTKYPGVPHTTVVKGDGKYLSIAAASILAKTYRDDYMNRLHEEFPYYDWDHNKGYPTKKHRAAIAERGTTPYHRMTFNLLGDGQLTLSF